MERDLCIVSLLLYDICIELMILPLSVDEVWLCTVYLLPDTLSSSTYVYAVYAPML